jgi:hypothetical protein
MQLGMRNWSQVVKRSMPCSGANRAKAIDRFSRLVVAAVQELDKYHVGDFKPTKNKKAHQLVGFIAGAGFEPTTFRL